MIRFRHKGNFKNTERFLSGASKINFARKLVPYGDKGVAALASATPKDSGEAAASWGYEISTKSNQVKITWTNSKMAGGVPLVILIQYGHGTGTGGYVQGVDFINPALRPIFDSILNDVWKEVTSL